MPVQMTPEAAAAHWAKTRTLMWICLVLWAVFSFVIHMFVDALNGITFIGFPLGFYMASQGSLVVFVALIFWYAARQNAIDEDLGAAED